MFKLEFDTDNAAFDGADKAAEVARILRAVAAKVEEEFYGAPGGGPVRDVNGNTVGEYSLS